ncbi:MAG: DNA helicase II [Gammaproteobacteria bacterium]|nr:DNA helicase II [Gammaproteobacteria bacterium]MCP4088733.1 DNA helicase II [Gammaproteobacteria bacterium]MCP4275224.1 DNA helicase II [Gammaproteobacteria bacterium]MCP4830766.1 DNA helicase II [Gammaproteobacteria bacterium]MCP4929555.1 DNA helicase II [Gammaproteobacteria bacterium]
MDVTPIIDTLNDAQREAVTAPQEPVLVIAGAGSGKTRVLVHRIAWLVEVEGISPHGIMAVTFTNKASAEMRGRVEQLLDMPVANLWVGTFHGLAHRLLRRHAEDVGLPKTFQIIDSQDQKRLIRRLIKDSGLDESTWVAREVQYFINKQKDEGRRPDHIDVGKDHTRAMLVRLYRSYQENCDQNGLVDFAELLLRAHELWLKRPEVLAHYQRRFGHILVDEFQDTNSVQFAWLRVLAGDSGVLFAVGDDDQSIYRWRGAKVENMYQLKKDFPGIREIKLEQNYRSTSNILNAANAIITNNSERLGKNLWTEDNEGEPIKLYNAYNERDEAEFVIARIQDWVNQGNLRADAAILYRSNAQSRTFEEYLFKKQIPYRVYGGLRFFERAEIKDALAYLRLLENRADDTSFERVVNVPTRGIGARTVDEIRDYARANALSLWESAMSNAGGQLNARATGATHKFLALVEELAQETESLTLHEQVDHVIERSGLIPHFKKDRSEQGETRIENLEELVSAAQTFEPDEQDELPPLAAFLSHAALEAGEGQADKWEDCVQLMTLHSAKGLEFPLVFMAGMEEGLFPHKRSINDPGGLEEERRLCYVGATRAMSQLYLSHADQRRMHGTDNFAQASRFLAEIPPKYTEEVRPNIRVQRPVYQKNTTHSNTYTVTPTDGIQLGQRVRHGKFGEGTVLNYEGSGSHARVQVNFEAEGTKWLVMSYAKLELM